MCAITVSPYLPAACQDIADSLHFPFYHKNYPFDTKYCNRTVSMYLLHVHNNNSINVPTCCISGYRRQPVFAFLPQNYPFDTKCCSRTVSMYLMRAITVSTYLTCCISGYRRQPACVPNTGHGCWLQRLPAFGHSHRGRPFPDAKPRSICRGVTTTTSHFTTAHGGGTSHSVRHRCAVRCDLTEFCVLLVGGCFGAAANAQMVRYQILNCSDAKCQKGRMSNAKCSNAQMPNAKMLKCSNAKMLKCQNAQMSNADAQAFQEVRYLGT